MCTKLSICLLKHVKIEKQNNKREKEAPGKPLVALSYILPRVEAGQFLTQFIFHEFFLSKTLMAANCAARLHEAEKELKLSDYD